jgi:beta-lactamase superfamily II metal-dependent hydrolase
MVRFRAFLLVCCISVSVFGQAANGKLQIHHIDMGQGDSAILISPKGETVLFDGGADVARKKKCSSIVDYLDQAGITEIDYIFVSHYHEDHIGCIPAVLEKFPLKHESFDRGQTYPKEDFPAYAAAVGSHRTTAQLGHQIKLDAASAIPVIITVEAFNGTYKGGSVNAKDENDVSLSALVSFGAFREEIGGDLSGEKTGRYVDVETGAAPSVGPLDVYKVHHHCSSHSSNANWMDATKPTVAIISVGDGNDYGHPAPDCIERLHDAEVSEVYWTEKGNGKEPGPKDLVSGDVVVEVPVTGGTFTITRSNGGTDTYKIKGAEPNSGAPGSPTYSPKFAWSVRSSYYWDAACSSVARISKANLQTGDTPPDGKTLHPCGH